MILLVYELDKAAQRDSRSSLVMLLPVNLALHNILTSTIKTGCRIDSRQ